MGRTLSLRSRLLIAIGIIALVALAVADVATYSALQSFLYNRVDQQLASSQPLAFRLDRGELLSSAARCNAAGQFFPRPSGQPAGSDEGSTTGPTGQEPPFTAILQQAVQVRSTSGGIVSGQSCPAYVDGKAFTPAIPSSISGFTTTSSGRSVAYFTVPAVQANGPTFRASATKLASGDLLIVAQPLGDIASILHHLLLVELAVTGAAVVVALLGGLWLVRIGLRPLRDMEAAAESIAEGNLTERVPGENETTEVGRLAHTLNVMLSRIESAFRARLASEERLRQSEARLRRFVADASHELRTPIAAISAYAQLFGRGASEQKEDLERLLSGITSETGRMEHLVADLLMLARLDEGRPMDLHPVDLVSLCAESVQTSLTVGPAWPVTFTAARPIEVTGDATGLRQVVDNLLGNVRSHTPEGTTTRVAVEPDGAGARITVADDGPGMPSDQVGQVFERFYRSDPSRSRLHGGAGLGLSIVSAIVAAHGGTVSATSALGQGTTITVHLPDHPPAQAADVTADATPSAGDAADGAPPAPERQ